jgi:RNA polymerase sigma-70 factor (ECF subfamily)
VSDRPDGATLRERYLDDVFRYVSAFVRPPAEAEDVTMDVFHAALTSRDRLRRGDDPRLWLLGIARRKVADCLRRRYRRREEPLAAGIQTRERDLDQTVLLGQVLAQIPRDHGQVLVLKYVNGLSTEEIARVLGRSTAAANSLLQRARESFYAAGAPHFLPAEDRR